MIAAGIFALEREDVDYEPDFVVEYRQKVVIPRIEQYQSEKKLAEGFNPYSDVPKELESDGWAFMGLVEVTNLHNRELVDGLLEGKSVRGDVLRDLARYDVEPCLSRQAQEHLHQPRLSGVDASSPTAREEAQEGDHRRLGRGVAKNEPFQANGTFYYRGHHRPATRVVRGRTPTGFTPRSTSRSPCIVGNGTSRRRLPKIIQPAGEIRWRGPKIAPHNAV